MDEVVDSLYRRRSSTVDQLVCSSEHAIPVATTENIDKKKQQPTRMMHVATTSTSTWYYYCSTVCSVNCEVTLAHYIFFYFCLNTYSYVTSSSVHQPKLETRDWCLDHGLSHKGTAIKRKKKNHSVHTIHLYHTIIPYFIP